MGAFSLVFSQKQPRVKPLSNMLQSLSSSLFEGKEFEKKDIFNEICKLDLIFESKFLLEEEEDNEEEHDFTNEISLLMKDFCEFFKEDEERIKWESTELNIEDSYGRTFGVNCSFNDQEKMFLELSFYESQESGLNIIFLSYKKEDEEPHFFKKYDGSFDSYGSGFCISKDFSEVMNHPISFRELIRFSKWTTPTSGKCEGYIQANVVILPKVYAEDFKEFCSLNYKACPVLEILENGETQPKEYCDDFADLSTDVPKYRMFKKGEFIKEVHQVKSHWRNDFYTFLIGCSFSFENALQEGGIEVRNITEGKNCSMYITNIQCKDAGVVQNIPMVVTMRPVQKEMIQKAIDITEEFSSTHGGPIYYGNEYKEQLGIQDLEKPDFGDAVTIKEGEIPMFWPCGVTAILASKSCKSDILYTHSPGHMFITDKKE